MKYVCCVVACLLVTAVNAAAETPLESWTTLEIPIFQTGRATTLIHTQLRVRNEFSDFAYARFGPNLRVRLNRGFTLVTGFWYIQQENTRRVQWDDMHRYWAGVERPIRAGSGVVQLRGIYEHWFGGPKPNDNRTRWLVLYRRSIGRGLTATGGTETFFDNNGYFAERVIANIGMPFYRNLIFEAGYMWDRRLERVGGPRQMITTTFRSRPRER